MRTIALALVVLFLLTLTIGCASTTNEEEPTPATATATEEPTDADAAASEEPDTDTNGNTGADDDTNTTDEEEPTKVLLPTLGPTVTPGPTEEPDPEAMALAFANVWAEINTNRVAGALIKAMDDKGILPPGTNLGLGLEIPVEDDVVVTIDSVAAAVDPADESGVVQVLGTVTITFVIDKPIVGGTYTASAPLHISVDIVNGGVAVWSVVSDQIVVQEQ